MKEYESLWHRLLDRLDDAGLLSLRSSTETPAEIGREIERRTGDQRVVTFVWRYYYPRAFGNEAGLMTDREAGILIDSFKRPPKEEPRQHEEKSSWQKAPEKMCVICGTNEVPSRGEL
jgi:hypothetical protein